MITNIIQYNIDSSITSEAQLLFFITVNNKYQTWNLTKRKFYRDEISIPTSLIQFEYNTP